MARKIEPSAVSGTLRRKHKQVRPDTFAPSTAAFSPFEDNLLTLLRRIPAKTDRQLERKIASLIPRRARAAAIAWARERSEDSGSYLVNLARNILANTPQELEQKISSLIIPAISLRGVGLRLIRLTRSVKTPRSDAAATTQTVPENRAVDAFLGLAHHCYAYARELTADCYVARGVEALPAAEIVAKTVGGRVYCDVVETPSFAQRSVKYDWHATNLALLDHAFDSYLRSVDGILTIGWALANELRRYGPPVTVIPNYRNPEELRPSDELREKCGLGSGDVLLLASSTICSGFEPVIEALTLLPDNVHLATLGRIVKGYQERLHSYPAEIGVQNRVHFSDEVPYARLTTVASGANLGLMALDPSLTNDRLSLPNRLFDSIAAGLPIVTPDVPDMARIVNQLQIGVTVGRNEAACWAEAIKTALAGEKAMRPRVLKASKELVWDLLGDQLHAAYGNAESVTIIGYSDLVGHQRTARMADALVKRGVRVTICCPLYQKEPPQEMPGVRFVFMPHPHAHTRTAPRTAAAKGRIAASPAAARV